MNRDLRDTTAAQQSKREEWAQGLILKAESGFTEGTVGFGLDAYAGLSLKLDSSADRAGTALLPNGFGNEGPDEYSEFSGAVKARLSKTVARSAADAQAAHRYLRRLAPAAVGVHRRHDHLAGNRRADAQWRPTA
jgi:hypothetical protein